jgi:hypothetical protein
MSAYIHYNLIPLTLLWPDGSSTMQVGFIQSDIARELNTSRQTIIRNIKTINNATNEN